MPSANVWIGVISISSLLHTSGDARELHDGAPMFLGYSNQRARMRSRLRSVKVADLFHHLSSSCVISITAIVGSCHEQRTPQI
ncbi:hypothetical protein F5148DRAFT_1235396 [Russula earlei]|uniref:Uncharacterized protein n=1 Tax=Russula earlei TaxID=71964 RepID=A0ACC0TZB5_9AGAM|nr:hypothetical protein F5148DRAFT_1235396 [Russula earlei]